MPRIIPALLLSALLINVAACDESTACEATPELGPPPPAALNLAPPVELDLPGLDDDLHYREQGPPTAVYITKLGGKPIYRKTFAALVAACKNADPPLTVTLTSYQPDTLHDSQVIGLGFSAVGPTALLNCYAAIFAANGAIKI